MPTTAIPTVAVTYIGGPTVLLEYASLRIVTDPTFDEPRRYPDPSGIDLVKSHGPAIARTDLGQVDLVLLSHNQHEDNLDYEGLELLAQGVRTLSTTKAANDLFGGGVVGLDAWESYEVGDVAITAVPALHGPTGSESRLGPVIGFVLEAPGEPTVYISGDNASLPLVEQIATRFPEIDIALLFAGAGRIQVFDSPITLTSADAVIAAGMLGASRVVGLHTEDWEHLTESRAQLASAFMASGVLVDTPRGERVEL